MAGETGERQEERQAAEQVYYEWVQRVQYLENLLRDVEENMRNIELLKEQLGELEKLGGNEDVLAPLANGIFVEARLKDAKTLKVNVGKGVLAEKTIPETFELIGKQEREVMLTREQIVMKLEELYEMAKQY
jgi:prefoldin alpha subunit